MDWQPGVYETISEVNIRKEPKLVTGNVVGKLSRGTRRTILSTQTDHENNTWGRISDPDAAGIAQWICMQTLNRTFVKLIEGGGERDIVNRFIKLENWAKTQGYDPNA